MLKCVIYISTLKQEITLEQIKFISVDFANNNIKHGITGILLFSSGIVMQYIEGDEEKVDKLYQNIIKDFRHYNIITLLEEYIEAKLFENWSLKFKIIDIRKIKVLRQQMNKNALIVFKSFITTNIGMFSI